jgi:hypothetical protein
MPILSSQLTCSRYESLHARPNIQNPEPFKEEYAAAKEVHDEEALVKYSQGNNRDDLDTIYRRAPTANQNLKQCLKSLKDLKALQAQKQTLENKAQDLFNRAMDMQDNARRLLTPPKTVQKAFKDSEAAFTAVSTFVRNNDTKMRRLQGEVDKCRAQNFGGMSTETLIKG